MLYYTRPDATIWFYTIFIIYLNSRLEDANLLAGRAFVNTLYPLTFQELGDTFDLKKLLHWGSLSKAINSSAPEEKKAYLRSYCLTYIKEEIQTEQILFFWQWHKKALEVSLDSVPSEGTYQFGDLFEAFIIQEIFRLNEYLQKDYRLSYFRTISWKLWESGQSFFP